MTPHFRSIVEDVMLETGYTYQTLLLHTRNKNVYKHLSRAKNELYLRLREAGYPYTRIGANLGKDHSTIMSGASKAKERRAEKPLTKAPI
jgi:chromosomal replication initiation ATPase DnaA